MRILYAAGNYPSSYFQLERFVSTTKNLKHIIKIAAHKLPYYNFNVDYTLDCLLNFTDPKSDLSFNGNYNYYINEIKKFSPDLIISDYEVYTANIALELGIDLWNVSPMLLYHSLDKKDKYNLGIKKQYSYIFNAHHIRNKYINFIINNAKKNYIVSHFCDIGYDININNFEWIRPDFILENNSIENKITYVSIKDNKQFIKHKSFYSSSRSYGEKLNACDFSCNDGSPYLLADSFYNQRFSNIIPRYEDIDSVLYSLMSAKLFTGEIMNDSEMKNKDFKIKLNNHIMFLYEHLERL